MSCAYTGVGGGADALVGAVVVEGFGVSALPWGEEGVEYELFAPPAACARAHGGDAHVAEGAGDDSEQAAGPPTPRCVGTLRLALLGEPTQPEPELLAARLPIATSGEWRTLTYARFFPRYGVVTVWPA